MCNDVYECVNDVYTYMGNVFLCVCMYMNGYVCICMYICNVYVYVNGWFGKKKKETYLAVFGEYIAS